MWTCSSCRTTNGANAMVCPSCGRPREDQIATAVVPGEPAGEPDAPRIGDYSTIEKKIRRVRIRRDVVTRWAVLFGVTCFVTSLVLFAVFPPIVAGFGRRTDEAIGFVVVASLVVAAIGTVIGAVVACVLEMLRPICVALFHSPEAFEREFGPVPRPREGENE